MFQTLTVPVAGANIYKTGSVLAHMELTVELEPCGREISSTVIEGAESGNLILTSGVCQSQAFAPGVTDSYYGVVEHTPSLVETGKTGLPDC